MQFQYCPACGRKLSSIEAGDDGNVPYCPRCDRKWRDHFDSCAQLLVANSKGELLMLRQDYLTKDYLTFIAGHIQPGERAEDTAIREAFEEAGLVIREEDLIYGGSNWYADGEILMHGFIVITDQKDLHLSSEVDEAFWIPAKRAVSFMFPDTSGNTQVPLFRRYEALQSREQGSEGS